MKIEPAIAREIAQTSVTIAIDPLSIPIHMLIATIGQATKINPISRLMVMGCLAFAGIVESWAGIVGAGALYPLHV